MRGFCVLAVVFACFLAGAAAAPCSYTSSSGATYDLTALSNKGPNSGTYRLTDNQGYAYDVNFCAPINHGGCGSDSTVCQRAGGGWYNLGTLAGGSWAEDSRGVRYQYLTGAYCDVVGRNRYSYFYFETDCTISTITLRYIVENPTCTYNFYISVPCGTVVGAGVPAAPVLSIAAGQAATQSVLTWPAVDTATSYSLYRRVQSSTTYQQLSSSAVSPFTDSAVVAGVNYVYYVLANNARGSSAPSNYVNYKYTAPVLSASVSSEKVECFGDATGSATVRVTAGTAPYTYLWSNGATTATATDLSAGSYTVRVTDRVTSITLTAVVGGPSAPLSLSVVRRTDVSYNGGLDGKVTVGASGGTSPYAYEWSVDATSDTATGLAAGTYIVNATDAFECFATFSFTVNQPAPLSARAEAGGVGIKCFGEKTATAKAIASNGNSAGEYTYLWDDGQTTAFATGLSAGVHVVRVRDVSGEVEATVTITGPSALVVVPAHTDATLWGRADGSASVSVSGGVEPYTYKWAAPLTSTASSVSGLAAGNYSVVVTDANGCKSTQSFVVVQPMWCYVGLSAVKTNSWTSDGITNYHQWNIIVKNIGTPQLITLKVHLSGPNIISQWNLNPLGNGVYEVSIWNGLNPGNQYDNNHGLTVTGDEPLVVRFVSDTCYPAVPPPPASNNPPATCTASVTTNLGSKWVDNNVNRQAYSLNIKNTGQEKIKQIDITFNDGATIVSYYNLKPKNNNVWGIDIWGDGLAVGSQYSYSHGFEARGNYVLVPSVVSVSC